MAKLIFGCGYLGERVAKLWRQRGDEVFAVTRSEPKAERLRLLGIRPIVADITRGATLGQIAETTAGESIETVLFAVGYDRSAAAGSVGGKLSIQDVYVDGLAGALRVLPGSVRRFLYISSSGVYGNAEGEWVDEATPCHPIREGGRACLAAEQLLARSPMGDRAVILRLAGIYGPGRIPRANDLQAGAAIAAPSQGYLNLIHVDDAARIVLLAEERAAPPTIYCVSDGQPCRRAEYYGELARLVGAPSPRFIDPPGESPAAQRALSDKRISNARQVSELRPSLLYPSYREGLAAAVGRTTQD
jgi:nucleoside-diphosphate-sugar epimerase